MDPMETTPTDTNSNPNQNPNPNPTQTPTTQAPSMQTPTPPSSSSTPEIPPSSSSSIPNQNPQPPNPLHQQQQQQQQQQPNFQLPQQRPPFNRTRPSQPPYPHFTPHLPPQLASSSNSSHSPSPSSSFSSAPPPSVSAAQMQRGGLAIGVPAHHTRPQQQPGSFSGYGSSPFNQQFGGLARNPINMQEQMPNSNTQGRSIQGSQTIGMIGALGSGSQMRPSGGVPGHHPPRPGQPQLRAQSPSNNQSLATQKFQGPGLLRSQPMASPGSSSPVTPQGSQQHTQAWMKGPMHMSSVPPPTYRPHMKPQTLQQRSLHPQQHQHHLPTAQHPQQMPSTQQQQQHQPSQSHQPLEQYGQQYLPPRIQQPMPHQQQATRAPASASQKSNVPTTMQPGTLQSGPIIPMGASTDATESGNQILSKRSIHELVSQIDPSEKLDPEVEDVLVEIAEDFIESITTIACSLAKHRKSNTLEAKDILLHLERNWNMTLPGFSGDEIKICKKPFMNDIHKERLAAVKKSMVGTETGNTKSSAGQAAGNPKVHAAKAPAIGSPKTRE